MNTYTHKQTTPSCREYSADKDDYKSTNPQKVRIIHKHAKIEDLKAAKAEYKDYKEVSLSNVRVARTQNRLFLLAPCALSQSTNNPCLMLLTTSTLSALHSKPQ